ncbi:hypothetical protein [Streptosporangium subroseum]|uniref:hypothetical protein n=1 Tax=Streptosporangium subroseum TaxID=106412 RepID=UPI003087CBFA|nr:hypothetical protein OHB15_00070 [Streptosporangium subroseum]
MTFCIEYRRQFKTQGVKKSVQVVGHLGDGTGLRSAGAANACPVVGHHGDSLGQRALQVLSPAAYALA